MKIPKINIKNIKLPDFHRPDTRKKFYILTGALVFLAIFTMFTSGVPFSTNSNLCGDLCHATKANYESWKRSTHAQVPCYFCHFERSYVGIYKERFIQPIKRFYLTTTDDFEKPVNKDSRYSQEVVEVKYCRRCHSPETRNFTVMPGLKITGKMHVKHLDAGLRCTTCHNRIAHDTAHKYEPLKSWKKGFKYKDFTKMSEGCFRCHSSDKNKRDPKTLAIIKNNKKAPTNCDTCHSPKWELMPTSGNFNHKDVNGIPWRNGKKRHGKVAQENFDSCLGCHERAPSKENINKKVAFKVPNCTTSCHKGITMPHNIPKWEKYYNHVKKAPKWLKKHPTYAKKLGFDACMTCHKSNEGEGAFCQKCHHKAFYEEMPNLSQTWATKEGGMKYVKEKGSYRCWKCHEPEFCSYCHTTGKKPKFTLKKNR